MAKIDQYNLTASTPQPILDNQEIDQNLALSINTLADSGLVQGTVTSSGDGSPISDATVKIFSSTGKPLYHSSTDTEGKYVIPNVPQGSYFITAAKQGYLTPVSSPISVSSNQPTFQNLTMAVDTDANLNTIYGKVNSGESTSSPIYQATVDVFQLSGSDRTLVDTTYTNSDGQYILPYLPSGEYIVVSFKADYLTQESSTLTLTASQKLPLNLSLTPLGTAASLGTVSGYITDQASSKPIPNAIVALYNVDASGEETLVQQTKTNANGRYLFGSVTSGTVVVKSFAQKTDTP